MVDCSLLWGAPVPQPRDHVVNGDPFSAQPSGMHGNGAGQAPAPSPSEFWLTASVVEATSHVLQSRPGAGGVDSGVCPEPERTSEDGMQATVSVSLATDGNDARGTQQAQEHDCSLKQIRSWLENEEAPDRSKMGA